MLRILRDYDAVWLTLLAWAIFVCAFAIGTIAAIVPLALAAVALIRALRWRKRGQRRFLVLTCGMATLLGMSWLWMYLVAMSFAASVNRL